MLDVKDFIKKYYGVDAHVYTLEEFEIWKIDNDHVDHWDYPLEEYKHIAENDIDCVPVRFKIRGDNWDFEYRFCEVPKED